MNDRVFVSLTAGEPLGKHVIPSMLRRLKRRAGVTGRVNPHSFRHRFAKVVLRKGGNLKAVSQLMNHSGVEITADIYGPFEKSVLGEFHERTSPLNDI